MKKGVVGGLLIIGVMVVAIVVAMNFFSYSKSPTDSLNEKNSQSVRIHDDKLLVVTSFYPLYYFAEQVAGERAIVINLTPNGVEPHEYEPSPREIAEVGSANAVFVLGHSFEPWVDSLSAGKALQILDGISATTTDPHIWLDPKLAIEVVNLIAEQMKKVDPAGISTYEENRDDLVAELSKLNSEYALALQKCSLRDFVTSHSAFGHLASRYHLNQISIAGLSPEAEPSVQKLTQIATFVKSHDIKYIFSESLMSPKLSQLIADETGVQMSVLNPLEGLTDSEVLQGKDYFVVMRENLANLTLALQCKK